MKILRIRKLEEPKGPVIAYFDIEFNGLEINDFSLRAWGEGFYVDVPKSKWKDQYWPTIEFKSEETRTSLLKAVQSFINDENTVVSKAERVSKSSGKTEGVQKNLKVPLTEEQRIAISKKYLPVGFAGSREDIKRMRAQQSYETKHRQI